MAKMNNIGYRVGCYDGYYGEFRFGQDDVRFIPWGRDIRLKRVFQCIETSEYYVEIGFFLPDGNAARCLLSRAEIAENGIAAKLSAKGASVSTKRADVLQQYLNQQYEQYKGDIECFHTGVGWLDVKGVEIYRAQSAVGELSSLYHGELDLREQGSYEAWRDMIVKDVLPFPALTLILIAGLSAVVTGFLYNKVTLLNSIISLAGMSSTGKTSAGILAASTGCRPALGVRQTTDFVGDVRYCTGGISTWDATKAALLTRMQGNFGVPIVLDELSKCEIKDLSGVVYAISEGVDKDRLAKDCTRRMQPNFHTTVVSIGEEKLTDRCRTQQAGVLTRIFEVSGQLTKNAEHANRIVAVCRENYGFAAPMLAEFMIHQGADRIVALYQRKVSSFRKLLPDSPFADRRAQQFGGLFLTTAVLAKKALGIDFDTKELRNFTLLCERDFFETPDITAQVYADLLAWVGVHRQKFEDGAHTNERFGKIYEGAAIPRFRQAPAGLIREIAIFPKIFQRFLSEHGYVNYNQIIKTWRNQGLVITDQQKTTYRRKVDGMQHDLIIVRQFQSLDVNTEEEENDLQKSYNRAELAERQNAIIDEISSNLAS